MNFFLVDLCRGSNFRPQGTIDTKQLLRSQRLTKHNLFLYTRVKINKEIKCTRRFESGSVRLVVNCFFYRQSCNVVVRFVTRKQSCLDHEDAIKNFRLSGQRIVKIIGLSPTGATKFTEPHYQRCARALGLLCNYIVGDDQFCRIRLGGPRRRPPDPQVWDSKRCARWMLQETYTRRRTSTFYSYRPYFITKTTLCPHLRYTFFFSKRNFHQISRRFEFEKHRFKSNKVHIFTLSNKLHRLTI